ncbi:hypothetical protein FGO68_gene7040 [Halteria grandinella]|uniref:Transmembrane protein n=1 Tax=Halteria grandinella TaxID=5974 RepID=A0A8J8T176_HALGN|nr:hypothetical protein FGO68_gene7040 [Halteria grandinella]
MGSKAFHSRLNLTLQSLVNKLDIIDLLLTSIYQICYFQKFIIALQTVLKDKSFGLFRQSVVSLPLQELPQLLPNCHIEVLLILYVLLLTLEIAFLLIEHVLALAFFELSPQLLNFQSQIYVIYVLFERWREDLLTLQKLPIVLNPSLLPIPIYSIRRFHILQMLGLLLCSVLL